MYRLILFLVVTIWCDNLTDYARLEKKLARLQSTLTEVQDENVRLKSKLEDTQEIDLYHHQSKIVTTIPMLYHGWIVQFDIKPYGTVSELTNIFFMTNVGHCRVHDDRVPSMFFSDESTKPLFNGNEESMNTSPLPIDEWSNIKFSQLKMLSGRYQYSIEINGVEVYQNPNDQPKLWTALWVYFSDPWHPAPKAFIKNFTVDTKPHY